MFKKKLFQTMLSTVIFCFTGAVKADLSIEESQKRGAAQFSKCYFCHSLKPGLHLTGPSLAEVWNSKAASAKGFQLYSEALKKSGLTWNEENLKKWITKPNHLVSGTTMTYEFAGDEESLKNLIQFLKVALTRNGYEAVLSKNWITPEFANGQRPKSWSEEAEDENMITQIEHCHSTYTLYHKSKKVSKHWEENINLRVSSDGINKKRQSVRLATTGSLGDRFLLLFPSLDFMKKMIKPCAEK